MNRKLLAYSLNTIVILLAILGFVNYVFIKILMLFFSINLFYLAYRGVVQGVVIEARSYIYFTIDYFSWDKSRFKKITGVKAMLYGIMYATGGVVLLFLRLLNN